jgi:hypothetical protein
MDEQAHPESPTIRQHHRQVIWQILLPFLLITGLVLAAVILTVFNETSQTSLWRDVSLIWLLTPALALALVIIVVLGSVIYGLARLAKISPRLTGRAQELTTLGAQGIRRIADGTVRPFVWVEQAGAAIRAVVSFFLGRK